MADDVRVSDEFERLPALTVEGMVASINRGLADAKAGRTTDGTAFLDDLRHRIESWKAVQHPEHGDAER